MAEKLMSKEEHEEEDDGGGGRSEPPINIYCLTWRASTLQGNTS
jgi:hypothetical protein